MSVDLHRAVQHVLADKHLGTPVFVRYLLTTQEKPGAILPHLARIAGTIRSWLGQPLERVYALGQVKTGQVTLTMEFRGGSTGLLGWWSGPQGIDLLVLGNRGAIYHESETSPARRAGPTSEEKPDAALLALIQRALASGRPEVASQ